MSAWIRGRTRLPGLESEVVELRRDLVRALANLILRTCKINNRNGRERRCDEAMRLGPDPAWEGPAIK